MLFVVWVPGSELMLSGSVANGLTNESFHQPDHRSLKTRRTSWCVKKDKYNCSMEQNKESRNTCKDDIINDKSKGKGRMFSYWCLNNCPAF